MIRIVRRLALAVCLTIWGILAFSQFPVVIDFEQEPHIETTTGVQGKAWNLGDVSYRMALQKKNPIKEQDHFTVLLWVKSDALSREDYVILSEIGQVKYPDDGWKPRVMGGKLKDAVHYEGWKIGVQKDGAWSFSAGADGFYYQYNPTAYRQSIRDGKWHLLGFSFDKENAEIKFYYDGEMKAIYQVPELKAMSRADSIVIGNSVDNEQDFRTKSWHSFYGEIDDITFFDRVLNREEVSQIYNNAFATIELDQMEPESFSDLKVTAFNIFHGGQERGIEVGKNRTIELLKKENADAFVIVETYGSGEKIADALGYELYLISSNLSIVSRYPIKQTFPIYKPFNSGGVELALPNGESVVVVGVWLSHLPGYKRPFFKNPNEDIQAFLEGDKNSRGQQLQAILEDIRPMLAQAESIPVIVAGDFNSGSHLDWTPEFTDAHNGYIIPFTSSVMAHEVGLVDSYRLIHTMDEKDGITFSVWDNKLDYLRDRIDYIYFKGKKLQATESNVFGIHPKGFPSDHAGVSTIFNWKSEKK
ncbi:LamG-like jellyroll fold domain-containing protein [Sphingobacterium haloxyli]|nr:LamG-like jellyroll fold domain-containing protein [Sphingobacterium haloxyli]